MRRTDSTRGQVAARRLSRRWLALLLIPAIAGTAAYLSEADNPARYRSTSKVLLQTANLGAVLAGVPDLGNGDPSRNVATEKVIASVPEVRSRALSALGAPEGSALATSATIRLNAADSVNDGSADILEVTVTATDDTFAEGLATAVAREYIAFRAEVANAEVSRARDQVQRRIEQLKGDLSSTAEYAALVDRAGKLETLLLIGNDRARLLTPGSPASKIGPNPVRKGAVGGVLGLLLAGALMLILERFDRSVRSDDEIADFTQSPILARLPDPRRLSGRRTAIALSEPSSAETEAFRLLRANLRFALLGRPGHSVGVSSAAEAEGKTFVACNLAVVAASAGARVVLVDLDLRRPTVHRVFDLERRPGVSDVLSGQTPLEHALVGVPVSVDSAPSTGARGCLDILVAGTATPNPGEVAASMALGGLLKDLEGRYDLVIVDTPPTTVVTDAIPIAGFLSGMLLVVRRLGARRTSIEALRDAFAPVGGSLGTVLTAAWKEPSAYYGYTSAPRQTPDDGRRVEDPDGSPVR